MGPNGTSRDKASVQSQSPTQEVPRTPGGLGTGDWVRDTRFSADAKRGGTQCVSRESRSCFGWGREAAGCVVRFHFLCVPGVGLRGSGVCGEGPLEPLYRPLPFSERYVETFQYPSTQSLLRVPQWSCVELVSTAVMQLQTGTTTLFSVKDLHGVV